MPAMTLSDSMGAVSPSGLTKLDCSGYFVVQFRIKDPATVTGSGKPAWDTLNVGLEVQNNAGLTGSTMFHIVL
jgi:hypothetical protein